MSSNNKPIRIAIDIGGTFTDLVALDENNMSLTFSKSPSTPNNIIDGIIDSILSSGVDLSSAWLLVHGTTMGLNALIRRSGAKTALITTKGFRDVLEIARMGRDDLYNIWFQRRAPLVPRPLRFEIEERIDANGNVVTDFNEDQARNLIQTLKDQNVEAIAVCFLHSYSNPIHEEKMGVIINEEWPSIQYSLSHKVSPQFREYERSNTVVVDAYIKPILREYLESMIIKLGSMNFDGSLMVSQSSGGLKSIEGIQDTPVYSINSGPAGGVVGSSFLSTSLGLDNLIAIDAGGTSFDVSLLLGGSPNLEEQYDLDGYPIMIPSIDIRSIGAGGGSIGWIDESGLLRVGPESAGADPGPACFGKGGIKPTVTDAALCRGILNADHFLGGKMSVQKDLSLKAISTLAEPLKLDVYEAAAGIMDIAAANMVGAIRKITIERGHDPREFSILSYGGATSMFASSLASELSINNVIVPPEPANFSAWGMLFTDILYTFSRTLVTSLSVDNLDLINNALDELKLQAINELKKEKVPAEHQLLEYSADMRYMWQAHYIDLPLPNRTLNESDISDIKQRFDDRYESTYGHKREIGAQIVHLKVKGIGSLQKPSLTEINSSGLNINDSVKESRDVYIRGKGFVKCNVYDRKKIPIMVKINGPAIVEESTSTTFIGENDTLELDKYGNLLIAINSKTT